MAMLIIALIGASAGGFFLYQSSTSRQSPTANDPSVASSETERDASSPSLLTDIKPTPIDAGVFIDAMLDRAVDASVPADASVVVPADAAAVVTTTPADASVIVTTPPPQPPPQNITDAAPRSTAATATSPVKSGRVLDPELSGATNDGVETVILTIQSRPPGALLYRTHDNLRLGKTPLEYVTKKFNANEDFALKLKGYYDVTFKMSTNRNGKRVELLLHKPKR